jgi:hypothetical protein
MLFIMGISSHLTAYAQNTTGIESKLKSSLGSTPGIKSVSPGDHVVTLICPPSIANFFKDCQWFVGVPLNMTR